MTRAETYAEIAKDVDSLLTKYVENEPTVTAYMIARVALLQVRGIQGASHAAELAYSLADQFAGEAT